MKGGKGKGGGSKGFSYSQHPPRSSSDDRLGGEPSTIDTVLSRLLDVEATLHKLTEAQRKNFEFFTAEMHDIKQETQHLTAALGDVQKNQADSKKGLKDIAYEVANVARNFNLAENSYTTKADAAKTALGHVLTSMGGGEPARKHAAPNGGASNQPPVAPAILSSSESNPYAPSGDGYSRGSHAGQSNSGGGHGGWRRDEGERGGARRDDRDARPRKASREKWEQRDPREYRERDPKDRESRDVREYRDTRGDRDWDSRDSRRDDPRDTRRDDTRDRRPPIFGGKGKGSGSAAPIGKPILE
ncbi:hypothetical protein DIPPA_33232 [Diplonema papillatum]|nr:hypothetical protein DIPPA_33232 [Diplonema papillatum]